MAQVENLGKINNEEICLTMEQLGDIKNSVEWVHAFQFYCKEKLELIICKCLKTQKKPLSAMNKSNNKLNPHIAFLLGFMWTQVTLMGTECCHHCATLVPKVKVKKGWFLKADTKEVTISKVNCRQYCFGLLGFISAVLMLGWKLSYEATPNDPTNVISSKPRQSALTSN